MKRKHRRNDDPEIRLAYLQQHDSCAVCWKRWTKFGANIQVHHLVGGSGRKDVLENLLTLCQECHDEYHRGFKLTPGMMLTAKRESDGENYDEAVILELLGRKAFSDRWTPVPFPEFVLESRERNRR